jgi:hypothetical protein
VIELCRIIWIQITQKFHRKTHWFIKIDRLSRLRSESLELNRLRFDLINEIYEICCGLTDDAANVLFTLARSMHSVISKDHLQELQTQNSYINIRKHFSASRTLKQFSCCKNNENVRGNSFFYVNSADYIHVSLARFLIFIVFCSSDLRRNIIFICIIFHCR